MRRSLSRRRHKKVETGEKKEKSSVKIPDEMKILDETFAKVSSYLHICIICDKKEAYEDVLQKYPNILS